MKRTSEATFREALGDVDLRTYIYKPSDRDVNWKPCDYMVWVSLTWERSCWFEVKDTDAVNAFPYSELRPAQVQGIRDAERIGIPYWLAIHWRRHKAWTISDAAKVLAYKASVVTDFDIPTSIDRALLMSRFGIESSPANLSSTLKDILTGDI